MPRPWGRARRGMITDESRPEAWRRRRSDGRGGQRGVREDHHRVSRGRSSRKVFSEGANTIQFRLHRDDSASGVQNGRSGAGSGKWARRPGRHCR